MIRCHKCSAVLNTCDCDWPNPKDTDMKPTHNTCTECGITKPIARFNKHPGMAMGRYNQCRMCMTQSQRNRRLQRKVPNPINDLLRKWGRV